MFNKINNWHLSVLVLVASVLSLILVQKVVFAQWQDPIGLPGETGDFHLVINPMAEDLDMNNHKIFGTNLTIDPIASDKILVDSGNIKVTNGQICLNGSCQASWPTGYWVAATGGIKYTDGEVGIGGDPHTGYRLSISRNDGDGTLKLDPGEVYTSVGNLKLSAGGAVYTDKYFGVGTYAPNKHLHVRSSNENAEIDIQSGSNTHWGLYQLYANQVDGSAGDLRFWNSDNRVTFDNLGNVGIGTTDPSARLEVVGNLEISGLRNNSGVNFFGSDCALGNYVYGINEDGTLDCRQDEIGSGTISEATVEGYIFDTDPATVSGIWTYSARPLFNGGTSGSTAPFAVDSTYLVSNLNADLLDGQQATAFQDDIGVDCSLNNYVYGVNDDGSLKCRLDQSSSGSLWTLSGSNIYRNSGNVGIGDTTPLSLLTVGNGDLFQVNSTGDLVKIKNVTYSWPSSQGGVNTYLQNDGSGGLTWSTVAAGAGDNLGNHTATQNIRLGTYYLSGDGTSEGVLVANDGQVVIMSNNSTGEALLANGAINVGRNTSDVAIKVGGVEALWYGGTNRFSWGYGGSSNYFADRVGIGVQPDDANYMLNVNGDALITGDVLTTGTDVAGRGSFNNGFISCTSISNITNVSFDCVSPLIKTGDNLTGLFSPGESANPQYSPKIPTAEAICWGLGSYGTYLDYGYSYSATTGNYYTYFEDGSASNPAKFYMTNLPYRINSVTCAR